MTDSLKVGTVVKVIKVLEIAPDDVLIKQPQTNFILRAEKKTAMIGTIHTIESIMQRPVVKNQIYSIDLNFQYGFHRDELELIEPLKLIPKVGSLVRLVDQKGIFRTESIRIVGDFSNDSGKVVQGCYVGEVLTDEECAKIASEKRQQQLVCLRAEREKKLAEVVELSHKIVDLELH